MLMAENRNSFRATLLAGASGLALMGAIVALPGAAQAQNVITGDPLTPGTPSATSIVTIGGTGNIETNGGSISTGGGNINALGGNINTNGGNLTTTNGNLNTGSGTITTTGAASVGSLDAGSGTITTTGNVTAGSNITLNGTSGNIRGATLDTTGLARAYQ